MKKQILIEDWQRCYRLWSVQLSAVGAVLLSILTAWPESTLYLWQMMPAEIRQLIPERVATGLAAFIFAMSAISRIIKQRPRNEK